MQASKPNSSIASEQRYRLVLVARLVGRLEHHRATAHRILDRAHDQPLAHLGRAPVAVFDDLGVVVAGIDVQQGKRKTAGTEGFFGQAQQADRTAAREEQGRVAALAGDFAQDVDGFRLESRPRWERLEAVC